MRGHVRRQSKGSWELKFDAGRDPKTGKRNTRYVTVRGTRKKAESELAKYLSQVADGHSFEASKLSVGDYLETWLVDHITNQVSAKTFERYAEIVRVHLIPAIGATLLPQLSPLQIEAYYTQARKEKRMVIDRDEHGRPIKGEDGKAKKIAVDRFTNRTLKHHHRVLSQALKRAVRLRLITRNPAADVDPPRPVRREMQILDIEQSARVLKEATGTSIEMPTLIALTTGMRRGEILGLRWKDVDLDRRALSVAQTLEETKDGLTFKAPKTEKSRRTISLPALTVEALRTHRKRQAEAMLALGKRPLLVCCRETGEPLHPRAVTKSFSRLVRRLDFKVRFHDLRHTHISHLLAAGVHPKVASERAGHASVSITLDVYSHLIPGMQEDAAARIDASLRTHLER